MNLSPAIRSILLANIDTRIMIATENGMIAERKLQFCTNPQARVAYSHNLENARNEFDGMAYFYIEVFHATEVYARS